MSKTKNYYYGISVDGLLLNIAEFERSGNKILLSRIESFRMDKPLYTEYAEETTSDLELSSASLDLETAVEQKDIDLENFDQLSDNLFSEEPTSDLMDLDTSKPSANAKASVKEEKSEKTKPEPEQSLQSNEIFHFISKFALDKGKISLSSIDSKTQWKVIKTAEKIDFKKIRKLALNPDQVKDPSCACSYVQNHDKSYYAVTHQGEFELMGLIKNCAKTVYNSKKPFHYQYVQPNEISFLNLYNMFYSHESSRYATLLYIGEETKFGMVVKDKKIVKLFPIMIFDSDPQRVRESVYAKLLLEQENFDFSLTENILLAGIYAKEDDIAYYNKKTGYNHNLLRLEAKELRKQKLDLHITSQINQSEIPAFTIPIALALKGIMQKNKDNCKFNLLSKTDAEARKVFKIAWHGFFILLLIFVTAAIGTYLDLTKNHVITNLRKELAAETQLLNSVRNFDTARRELQRQIDSIHETHSRSATIDSEKNSWSEILYRLSDFSSRNPLIWIENVTTQNDRFSIRGRSYHRDRITALAQLFQEGNITRINEADIVGHTVWDFEISYKRPVGNLPVQIPLPPNLMTFESFREYIYETRRIAMETPQTTPTTSTLVDHEVTETQTLDAPTEETPQAIPNGEGGTGFAFINDPVDSRTLFNLAQDSYLSNNFNDAIALLDRYLHLFPEGTEIAQANYLLGEIYFILNSFSRAIESFSRVHTLGGEKVPEALFFMARSYELINDITNATRFYTILANDFSSSPLSRTAQEHLNIIRGGQR